MPRKPGAGTPSRKKEKCRACVPEKAELALVGHELCGRCLLHTDPNHFFQTLAQQDADCLGCRELSQSSFSDCRTLNSHFLIGGEWVSIRSLRKSVAKTAAAKQLTQEKLRTLGDDQHSYRSNSTAGSVKSAAAVPAKKLSQWDAATLQKLAEQLPPDQKAAYALMSHDELLETLDFVAQQMELNPSDFNPTLDLPGQPADHKVKTTAVGMLSLDSNISQDPNYYDNGAMGDSEQENTHKSSTADIGGVPADMVASVADL